MPTWLLKACAGELAPFLCKLFNASLHAGVLPGTFKSAFVTPVLKKTGLAEDDVKNCRPISNLSVVSKLLERLVASQLLHYLIVIIFYQSSNRHTGQTAPRRHRDSHGQGVIRHSDGVWSWRHCRPCLTGLFGGLWHRRSQHFTSEA